MKLDELKRLLLQADPAVVLVPPRVLRSIIQREHRVPYLLLDVPHEKCHVFDRQVVFREVEQDKLELEPDRRLPESVILIAKPSPEELDGDRDALLLKYWRFLFHSRVDQSLLLQAASGQFGPAALRSRIEALGQTEFEEIRSVLRQENFLANPEDDLQVYIEFAALYLDLRYFASNLRNSYFPSLRDFAAVDAILAQDVEAETLFRESRLQGAPDPVVRTDTSSDESNDYYNRLLAQADSFAAKGDLIRAAIIRTKAARVAPAALTLRTRRLALADLEKLTQRLKAALSLDDEEASEWMKVLPSLLDKADQGQWTVEARLLTDLQNVCVEFEKQTFTLDVVEWLISAGHRPMQRPLHSLQIVRMVKHLRGAAQRLTQARISDDDRKKLSDLLQTAQQESEARLRARFRPVLGDALADVGLRPTDNPEKAAQKKLVEEILDRIAEHGFFTFADLRDAIARNQLKMNDLADPYDFWRGDALLRLDRRLGASMDGVYRRGEFYMRLLERLSSLLFGTEAGRFLTLNLILPFGGAFVLLAMLDKFILRYFETETTERTVYPHWTMLGLGAFFLALLHSPNLREGLTTIGRLSYRLLRFILYDGPRRFFRWEVVQRVFRSWAYLLFSWYLLKPLLLSLAIWWLWPATIQRWDWAAYVFIGSLLALHSKYGGLLFEAFSELLALVYSWLRFDLLQGLYRWTLYFFKKVSDGFEYVLYSVDEWLRFTSGESRWRMVARAILGVLWFPIGYVARLYFLTMVEPTINPLKLPLSTLAAKFMFPLYAGLLIPFSQAQTDLMAETEQFVGYNLSVVLMIAVIWPTLYLLPSICAFFVWEMKGNWRAFRANRPKALGPVVVGQRHGETLPMLLRPGFHSGTVPKLYANLRQAERQAYRTGEWRLARAYRQELRETAAAVQVFVEREFIALIREMAAWRDEPLSVGPIELAGNRIAVDVRHAGHPERPVRIGFDERSGWLLAGLLDNGWLDQVDAAIRVQLTLALAGLYKLAGADLIREQIGALLEPKEPAYDITEYGLTLWPLARDSEQVSYDLNSLRAELRPRLANRKEAEGWPRLPAARLRYAKRPILWDDWVSWWRDSTEGQSKSVAELLPGWTLCRPWPSAGEPMAVTELGAHRNGSANGHARNGLSFDGQKLGDGVERNLR